MTKKIIKTLFYLCLIFLLLLVTNVDFNQIRNLPENFLASQEDVNQINKSKKYGSIIKADLGKIQETSKSEKNKSTIVFKLFGFIPIKKIIVRNTPEEDVFAGGNPLGISGFTNGVLVLNTNYFENDKTLKSSQSLPLEKGDLINQINQTKVDNIDDVKKILEESDGESVEIMFKRGKKNLKSIVKKQLTKNQKIRLGLLVKDDISGVGTLTFVKKDGSFGALGHAMSENQAIIPLKDGNVYDCSLLNIQKAEKNKAGQLKCVFLQGEGNKGSISKNTDYGVFGKLKENNGLIDENLTYKIGGMLNVSPGDAKIVSAVSGIREEYDIEIIKANKQSSKSTKGITFRVKDKRLLDLTGGIVQGMSGSPIVQNRKIIGAVTHVFLNDSTKGYGVYSDWMMDCF